MCDVAYVLLLEQTDRHAMADRQAALVLLGMSGALDKADQLPDIDTYRQVLDESLGLDEVALANVDPERLELMQALGIA